MGEVEKRERSKAVVRRAESQNREGAGGSSHSTDASPLRYLTPSTPLCTPRDRTRARRPVETSPKASVDLTPSPSASLVSPPCKPLLTGLSSSLLLLRRGKVPVHRASRQCPFRASTSSLQRPTAYQASLLAIFGVWKVYLWPKSLAEHPCLQLPACRFLPHRHSPPDKDKPPGSTRSHSTREKPLLLPPRSLPPLRSFAQGSSRLKKTHHQA